MLNTEEEAKLKWCPHARVLGQLTTLEGENIETGPQNRGSIMGDKLPVCLCIATDCMAWRWSLSRPRPDASLGSVPEGFCGLADRP